MTTTDLAARPNGAALTTNDLGAVERLAVQGDLKNLSESERVAYYGAVCKSLGINPLTRPFEYIVLNDKLTLYAKRDATDQLRKLHGVTVQIVNREVLDGVYVVTARATTPDGRADESIGAVPLMSERGEWKTAQSGKRYFAGDGSFAPLAPTDRANQIMRAETKAKRRVTLSIVGLGWLDETETETIPGAQRVAAAAVESAPARSALPPPPDATEVRADLDGEFLTALTATARPAGDPDPAYERAVDRYQQAWDILQEQGRPPQKDGWGRDPGYDLTAAQLARRAGQLEAAAKEPRG